jgi:hypothetical protein
MKWLECAGSENVATGAEYLRGSGAAITDDNAGNSGRTPAVNFRYFSLMQNPECLAASETLFQKLVRRSSCTCGAFKSCTMIAAEACGGVDREGQSPGVQAGPPGGIHQALRNRRQRKSAVVLWFLRVN